MTNIAPFKEIPLSGKHFDKKVLVSPEDYDTLSRYKWYLVSGYAQCTVKGKAYKMHRLILNATPNTIVDHRDRNKLNNQRENLRIADKFLNIHNRAAGRVERDRNFLGVEKLSNAKSYRAVITRYGKRICSNNYKTELAAAIKFNRMLDEYGFVAVKNETGLSIEQENEILIKDSALKPKASKQSGIQGITFNCVHNKWMVRKTINGKRKILGMAENIDAALRIMNSVTPT